METGDVHTGCFGTNWYKIGGPYSLMWYWTMIAFSFNGLIGFLWIPLIIGQLLAFLLFRKNKWLVPHGVDIVINVKRSLVEAGYADFEAEFITFLQRAGEN